MDIKISPFGNEPGESLVMTAQHDWPEGTYLQAGRKGIVIVRGGENYRTCYVEAFTPEHLDSDGNVTGGSDGFWRGEGATLEEAEDACWAEFHRAEACPGHVFEARGYTNGGGFCTLCNRFKGKAFTAEELGQHCLVCQTPTTYNTVLYGDERFWACEEHSLSLEDRVWYNQTKFFIEEYPEAVTEAEKEEVESLRVFFAAWID